MRSRIYFLSFLLLVFGTLHSSGLDVSNFSIFRNNKRDVEPKCPEEPKNCYGFKDQTEFSNMACFATTVAQVQFKLKGDCVGLGSLDLKVGSDDLKTIKAEEVKVAAKSTCSPQIDFNKTYCLLLKDNHFKKSENILTLDEHAIVTLGACSGLEQCSQVRAAAGATIAINSNDPTGTILTGNIGATNDPQEPVANTPSINNNDSQTDSPVTSAQTRAAYAGPAYSPAAAPYAPPPPPAASYAPPAPAPASYAPPPPPAYAPPAPAPASYAPPPPPAYAPPAPAPASYAPPPPPAYAPPPPAPASYAPPPPPAYAPPPPAPASYAPPPPPPAYYRRSIGGYMPSSPIYDLPAPAYAPLSTAIAYPLPPPPAASYAPPPPPPASYAPPPPAAASYAPPPPASYAPPAPAASYAAPAPAPASYAPPAPAASYAPPPPPPASYAPPAPAASYAPPPPPPASYAPPAPAASYAPPPPPPASYAPPPPASYAPSAPAASYAPPAPAPASYAPPPPASYAPPPPPVSYAPQAPAASYAAPAPAPASYAHPAPAASYAPPAPAPASYAPPPPPPASYAPPPPAPVSYAPAPVSYAPPPPPAPVSYASPAPAPVSYAAPELTYSKKIESYNLTAPVIPAYPVPAAPAAAYGGPSYKRGLIRKFPLFRGANLFEDYYASSYNISDVCPEKPTSCPLCYDSVDDHFDNICNYTNVFESRFDELESNFKFNISKEIKTDQELKKTYDFVLNEKCLEKCPQLESSSLLMFVKTDTIQDQECLVFDDNVVIVPSTYMNKFDIKTLIKKNKCHLKDDSDDDDENKNVI